MAARWLTSPRWLWLVTRWPVSILGSMDFRKITYQDWFSTDQPRLTDGHKRLPSLPVLETERFEGSMPTNIFGSRSTICGVRLTKIGAPGIGRSASLETPAP